MMAFTIMMIGFFLLPYTLKHRVPDTLFALIGLYGQWLQSMVSAT